MYLDTVVCQRVGKNLRGIALLPGQEHRVILCNDDVRAQPAKSLRKFTAQRPTANDQKPPRQRTQLENVLIGPVAGCIQSGDCRYEWPRTGRNLSLIHISEPTRQAEIS